MAVHIYGHPCDMDAIKKIARKHKLLIIEDAAEAIGAEYRGKRCGSFGDISCFSFYPNKTITTGEGGMLLTNNKKFKERTDMLRDLGFVKEKRYYHSEIARNYRMTNIQAALGIAQLKNIRKLITIKRLYGALYNKLLANIPGLNLPAEKPYAKNIYWMYGVVLDKSTGFNNESFARKLAQHGIGTRSFFYPLHRQPVWKKSQYRRVAEKNKGNFPIADKISKQGLYLPSGLGNTEREIKYVSKIIRKLLS
jgi:perosamine synthetase